jgi:hypothetical protein
MSILLLLFILLTICFETIHLSINKVTLNQCSSANSNFCLIPMKKSICKKKSKINLFFIE